MKLWMKYVLGIILGFGAARYLPPDIVAEIIPFFPSLTALVIRIGTYFFLPLLFFGLSYTVFKLLVEKRFFPVVGKSFLVMITSGVLLTLIGLGTVLLFRPERIPVIIESDHAFALPSLMELLLSSFPSNLFSIFSGDSSNILPFLLLGLFLGFGFAFDKVLTRPAVQFFDSFSRIFYRLARICADVLSIGMIILAAGYYTTVNTPELSLFGHLFLLLAVNCVIIILGIYPLLIFLLTGERNPYRLLYGLTAPALAAAVSGNSHFTYIHLALHVKENLGVPRPVGATALPLFTLFGKAGTAMVSAVGFIVLLSSYSSLGIGPGEVLWIFLMSFGISFFTGSVPHSAVLTAIAVLCAGYGRGIDDAYLILLPALPLLMSFATLLDTITAGLGIHLVAHREVGVKEMHAGDFI
jgi:Na+/H+-dicarboxylate symporter